MHFQCTFLNNHVQIKVALSFIMGDMDDDIMGDMDDDRLQKGILGNSAIISSVTWTMRHSLHIITSLCDILGMFFLYLIIKLPCNG